MKFWVWIVIAATILTLGIIVIGFWQHLFNQPHNATLPQWGVVNI